MTAPPRSPAACNPTWMPNMVVECSSSRLSPGSGGSVPPSTASPCGVKLIWVSCQPEPTPIEGVFESAFVPAVQSGNSSRAQLDADPCPNRPDRLGDGVFPGPLTTSAHDQQVPFTDLEPARRTAPLRPEQQATPGTQRDDRHQGVDGAAPPDGVPMPGNAVPAVPVETEPSGEERTTWLVAKVGDECGLGLVEHRMGQRLVLAIEGQETGHIHRTVVHLPAFRLPGNRVHQLFEQRGSADDPAGEQFDPGCIAQVSPLHRLQGADPDFLADIEE